METVKVLIVEDDPMVSFLHKALIVKKDICSNPESFMNGLEAFEFLQEDSEKNKESAYLILLDINMPLMNGWEFLEAIEDQEFASRCDVIVVTSSPDKKDQEKASAIALVSEYIEKPMLDFSPVIKRKEQLEKKILKGSGKD